MNGSERVDLAAAPVRSRVVPGLSLEGGRAEVVARLLARTWDVAVVDARAWLEGERADVEHLHQFRVALRRCRVYERELGAPLEREVRAALREPMRNLFRASGPLRDLHALRTSDDPVLAAIREAAPAHVLFALNERARAIFEERFRSEETAALGETLRLLPFAQGNDDRPFDALLDRRIERRLERTRSVAGDLREDSPATHFHRLRRSAKKLRYLVDVRLARGDGRGSRMRKETARLQEALGAFQDFVVAESLAADLHLEIAGAEEARQARRAHAYEAAARFARKS